jgi:hypothetical protein
MVLALSSLLFALAPAASWDMHSYSWSTVPAECRHITPFLWFTKDSDPAKIASESLKRPAGHRVLFSWDMHGDLLSNPGDRCRTADGQDTKFQGVWPEKGLEAVRVRFDDFFRHFKDAGGQMDLLILDFEGNFSNWAIGGVENKDHWLAIQNDPRFPALATTLGFEELLTVANFFSGRSYLKWNAVMAGVADDALNRAVFLPARKYFPGLRGSNYGSCVMTEKNAVPDLNGHMQWTETVPMGTYQAPSFYTWIGQLAGRQLDGKKPFGQSPFAGLLLTLNTMRAVCRSSPMPVTPWVAWQRYAGDGPGCPPATVANTPYYREMVLHLALTGSVHILFWNPHPWLPSQDPATMSLPRDEQLLDGILDQLTKALAGNEREALTLSPIPWDATVIATALRIDKRVLWRFTFAPEAHGVTATLDGRKLTIAPEPGEVGAWFSHPAAKRLVLQ